LLEHSDPAIEHDDEKPAAELVIADLVLCEVLRGIPDAREYAAVKDVLLRETGTAEGNRDRPRIQC
ncbi:MAG: hypothetical protein L0H63_09260, partial [Nitrococcus sp.]|nr:hypothetical protein [Nitrococcus sp.]